jgi:hypothetical protein
LYGDRQSGGVGLGASVRSTPAKANVLSAATEVCMFAHEEVFVEGVEGE